MNEIKVTVDAARRRRQGLLRVLTSRHPFNGLTMPVLLFHYLSYLSLIIVSLLLTTIQLIQLIQHRYKDHHPCIMPPHHPQTLHHVTYPLVFPSRKRNSGYYYALGLCIFVFSFIPAFMWVQLECHEEDNDVDLRWRAVAAAAAVIEHMQDGISTLDIEAQDRSDYLQVSYSSTRA
jgi:hypothetical protein